MLKTVLILTLGVVLAVAVACGDDEPDEEAMAPTAAAAPTAAPTAAPAPTAAMAEMTELRIGTAIDPTHLDPISSSRAAAADSSPTSYTTGCTARPHDDQPDGRSGSELGQVVRR